MLQKYFDFKTLNTNYRTEIIAGLTTFLTMAYVIVVYPAMLNSVGVNGKAIFVATCLAAAFGSILMGVISNYPIALAPSMSLGGYFVYSVISQYGIPWPQALGATFIAGCLFFLLTVSGIRQQVITTLPNAIKIGMSAGIGLFLGAIACKNIGIIHLTSHIVLTTHIVFSADIFLCLLGLLLIALLDHFAVPGAILWGIILITICGIVLKLTPFLGIFSLPPSMADSFLALQLPQLHTLKIFTIIFTFVFVAFFDNTGTLIGILQQAKLIAPDGKAANLKRAFFADSIATMVGSCLGTSSVGSYIESAAGTRAGGRTGLTAIVVGLLFLLALFLAPLASSIPVYATAAALLYIALLMLRLLFTMDWRIYSEFIPAVITACAIPFTFSIVDGIGLGLVCYLLINLITRNFSKINLALIILTSIFIAYLLFNMLNIGE